MIWKPSSFFLLILTLAACSLGAPSLLVPSATLAVSTPPQVPTFTDTAVLPVTEPSAGPTAEFPQALPPESPPSTKLVATFATPHIDQPPDGVVTTAPSEPQDCGYQWAYQDLPGLSSDFLQSIQALQPGTQASAFAFGENCVHADGSTIFLPMETDFNITLQASNLTDEATLGEWFVKVMQLIENSPPEQISGQRPGRVSITFEANGERDGVNFYIDQYRALPAGLSQSQIYQALKPKEFSLRN